MRRSHSCMLILLLLWCLSSFACSSGAASNRLPTVRIDPIHQWRHRLIEQHQQYDEPDSSILVTRIGWSMIASSKLCTNIRYTMFASSPNDDDNGEPPVSLCTRQSNEGRYCEIEWMKQSSNELRLQVLAECQSSPRSGRSRTSSSLLPGSSISPAVTAHRPSLSSHITSIDHTHMTTVHESSHHLFEASPGVLTVSNDTLVRIQLCTFYNQTSLNEDGGSDGGGWLRSDNWCFNNVSVCNWFGITCNSDPSQSEIISFELPSNHLISSSTFEEGGFSNTLFQCLTYLQDLDLSNNKIMMPLAMDLSPLVQLQTLNLSHVLSVMSAFRLPTPSLLRIVDVTSTVLMVNLHYTPYLEELYADHTTTFLNLADLSLVPSLKIFQACDASLTTGFPQGYDANVTQRVFRNLIDTNPVLEVLSIGGNALNFDLNLTHGLSGGDFPTIRSPSLRILNLTASKSLHTLPIGPDERWLETLPNLEELYLTDMQGLGSVSGASPYSPAPTIYTPDSLHVNTTAFRYGSTKLRIIKMDRTSVVGDLEDLSHLSSLELVSMNRCNIKSQLPSNLGSSWPSLRELHISGSQLYGLLPSFKNLTNLTMLDLSGNTLSGEVSSNFLEGCLKMEVLRLSSNHFEGELPNLNRFQCLKEVCLDQNGFVDNFPEWYLPNLRKLTLAHNTIMGSFPNMMKMIPSASSSSSSSSKKTWWDLSPNLIYLDLSQNALTGSIPESSNQRRWFETFSLGSNLLTGSLPLNITAVNYDVSYNSLSGTIFLSDIPGYPPTDMVNLGFNNGFICPIDVSSLTSLTRLDMPFAGFEDCDFNIGTQVQLPRNSLQFLDISHNRWKPMLLSLEQQSLTVFKASNASILGFSELASGTMLHSVFLSHNPLVGSGSTNNPFTLLFQQAPGLQFLYCDSCSISMELSDFIASLNQGGQRSDFYELSLADNLFTGQINPSMWLHNDPIYSLPTSLRMLVLAGNKGIYGTLPDVAAGYSDSEYIDLSGTSITGSIPDSWQSFLNLQRLALHDTNMSCLFDARQQCVIPNWIGVSKSERATGGENEDEDDDESETSNYFCPGFVLLKQNYSIISVDEKYYYKTLCECNAKLFGRNGECAHCPGSCTCHGDVISDCFPIVNFVASSDSTSLPILSIDTIMTCPLTVTGMSLCNPNGISWPGFDLNTVGGGALNLTDFCYIGHTDRLCSRCSTNYFSSGRWCIECMGESAHILIIVANVILFLVLISYLYLRTPSTRSSLVGLNAYHRSVEHSTRSMAASSNSILRTQSMMMLNHTYDTLSSSPSPPPMSSSSNMEQRIGYQPTLSNSPHGTDESHGTHKREQSITIGGGGSVGGAVFSNDLNLSQVSLNQTVSFELDVHYSNPLRLLVFHGQQLSILLLTATSLPPVLAGFMSIVSTGSSFSISSIFALECLTTMWTLSAQAWAALIAPIVVIMIALSIYGWQLLRQKHGLEPWSSAPRWYGVCVSLLYIFVFPCAQTSLASIACTDFREYHPSTTEQTKLQPSNRIYLNLYPYIECNSEWESEILVPGLLGSIFWVFLFPIFSTLLFKRLRRRLDRHSDVAVWPLCVELLKPFHIRCWWWEQALLIRRLLLVLSVTLIPSSSLYLPIALFGLIQCSALLQHVAQPYISKWLNRGELFSLYILLLNYITALVLHEELSGVSDRSDVNDDGSVNVDSGTELNFWTVCLFFINVIFILIMILGLFKTLQQGWMKLSTKVLQTYCTCCGETKRRKSVQNRKKQLQQQQHHRLGNNNTHRRSNQQHLQRSSRTPMIDESLDRPYSSSDSMVTPPPAASPSSLLTMRSRFDSNDFDPSSSSSPNIFMSDSNATSMRILNGISGGGGGGGLDGFTQPLLQDQTKEETTT